MRLPLQKLYPHGFDGAPQVFGGGGGGGGGGGAGGAGAAAGEGAWLDAADGEGDGFCDGVGWTVAMGD